MIINKIVYLLYVELIMINRDLYICHYHLISFILLSLSVNVHSIVLKQRKETGNLSSVRKKNTALCKNEICVCKTLNDTNVNPHEKCRSTQRDD